MILHQIRNRILDKRRLSLHGPTTEHSNRVLSSAAAAAAAAAALAPCGARWPSFLCYAMLAAHYTSVHIQGVVAANTRLPKSITRLSTGRAFKAKPVRCAADAPSPEAAERGTQDVSGPAQAAAAFAVLPVPPNLHGASPQGRWNAVSLAYLGDAVWEAMLRSQLYNASNTWQYGNRVAAMVTTQAQAACYELLRDEGWLAPAEAALMRWASNSSSVSPPAHATRQQYKQATALETLVAHLYLTDVARLQQLLDWLLQPSRVEKWQQPLPVPAHARHQANSGNSSKSSATTTVEAAKPGKRHSSTTKSRSGAAKGPSTHPGGRRARGVGRWQ